MSDVRIRPMQPDDVPTAEQISDEAFYDVDVRTHRAIDPTPERRSPEHSRRWIDRTRRFLVTDADGCWVAESDEGVIGFATSLVRERAWVLVTYAIRPGHQGKGIGKRLLDAAQQYGARCEHAMLSASDDPAALRRYHLAGFVLHPQLTFRGEVDRSTLPAVSELREGTADDREWMDDLDRIHRGGPHGPDHAYFDVATRLVVATERTGYAYSTTDGAHLIVARDEAVASDLLWESLAGAEGEFAIGHVTTANPWVVDVAMRARLRMGTSGHLGLRGLAPPAPYLHHGALL